MHNATYNVTHADDAPPISVLSITDGRVVNVNTMTIDKSVKPKHQHSRFKSAAGMGAMNTLLTITCVTVLLLPL
jgi:hypothetical protein